MKIISGVIGKRHTVVTDVLIRFPIIAQQHSNGVHYFYRVVGLVVINIHQWILL